MKVFSEYVSFHLILLLIALVWLAIGGIHWELNLLGAGVAGAVVFLARRWAAGWKDVSANESIAWLVAGALILSGLALVESDQSPKWIWRVTMLSAASVGMGIAGLSASIIQEIRKK